MSEMLIKEIYCEMSESIWNVRDKATRTILVEDIEEEPAKELVRRWNAFEDGELVDELRTTLENALTTLAIISMPRQDDNVATDTELLKILSDSFRAALAKS